MDKHELQERMTNFAVRIVKMVDAMPSTVSGLAIARQIVRSGTSPSANYRAACLAKSDKDFINKLKMVEEELDETCHWLKIIMRSELMKESRIKPPPPRVLRVAQYYRQNDSYDKDSYEC